MVLQICRGLFPRPDRISPFGIVLKQPGSRYLLRDV